ncbi:IS3 family transposase [Corynebacterium phocae]|uniref:IS3 family transposase n=1 Tax=Corynebacterium phocae TaxID=161895 RepID=UPI0014712F52|nr:IS3 family transposase [Corynebacterium phocae]
MPKKFDQQFKDRAVRLIEDRILSEGESVADACKTVAPRLNISWHTARVWVQQARRDGSVQRAEEDVIEENMRLRREIQQLRDTNELLKLASAFFAFGTRPATSEMIRFIDTYRDQFCVEFICKTLNDHHEGGFITPRGYRMHKSRGPSARAVQDKAIIEVMLKIHKENYGVYGYRKMYHALRREGIDIGRDRTARLMRLAGISGKGKGSSPKTTRPARREDTRLDLVNREFTADAPNRLWVADITYVGTRKGFAYTAFVTDVFSRKIVGWATSKTMSTEQLPLQALKQALANADDTSQLVHHADHGSQYVSVVYGDTLAKHGVLSSTGTVGDSYDNAMAENVNGSYKNEAINDKEWEDEFEVEIATFEWVSWWNEVRLHEALGYRTPLEVEAEYCSQNQLPEIMETKVNC